eukprot:GHVT01104649.1.p1 GENE.GHVT01104649.1~~GHVT01104649.1.p1  ORF type:complete len:100 (+),score=6.80 GHVT01104649.1:553-852(+)
MDKMKVGELNDEASTIPRLLDFLGKHNSFEIIQDNFACYRSTERDNLCKHLKVCFTDNTEFTTVQPILQDHRSVAQALALGKLFDTSPPFPLLHMRQNG